MRFIRFVILLLLIAMAAALFLWGSSGTSDAHVPGCHTTKCDRRIHLRRAHHYCVKKYGAGWCWWRDRYRTMSHADRAYAQAVRDCEKGDRPGDHSSFIFRAEWTRSTWHAAGGADYYPSVWEEDWRIVHWTRAVGYHSSRGWPNCP